MSKFATIDDHVAIHPKSRVERITARGVILPAETRDPFVMWGDVLATGPGHRGWKTGNLHPMTVRPGDKVLYLREASRQQFDKINVNGTEYDKVQVVQERDINLIVRGDEIIPINNYVIGKILPTEYEYEEIIDPMTRSKIRVAGKYIELGEGKRFFMPTQISDAEEARTEKVPIRVKVVKVGPGERADSGFVVPMEMKPGDVILVSKYFAWEFILDDNDPDTGYVVMKADEIYGIELQDA